MRGWRTHTVFRKPRPYTLHAVNSCLSTQQCRCSGVTTASHGVSPRSGALSCTDCAQSPAAFGRTQLHSAALSCTRLHSTALSCTQLHSTALSCTQLHSAALNRTQLHSLCAKGCKQDAPHLDEHGRHAGWVEQQPCVTGQWAATARAVAQLAALATCVCHPSYLPTARTWVRF